MQQIYIKNTIKKYFIYIHLFISFFCIHHGDHVLAAYTYTYIAAQTMYLLLIYTETNSLTFIWITIRVQLY